MAKDARKPTVTLTGIPFDIANALRPVKTTLEMLTGSVNINNELKGLKSNATNEQIVAKLNEVIRRLNASGGDHV